MFGIVTGLHIVASFPISFFSGHVLEHRYGLSRQSLGRWLARYLKKNGFTLLIGLLLFEGLYAIIWYTQSWWWLVAAVAFFAVSIVIGQLTPVLIIPLFYKIKRLDDQTLAERFRGISEGTGLTIEGVYRMEMSAETAKANAMLAGLGATRRVILGDTLLDEFNPDEIEVIFAHEVGHHVHRHIHKMIAIGIVYSLAGFYLCDRFVAGWIARHEGALDYANFPVWTVPALMLTIALFSLFVEPLQNSISRFFERQCDRYALKSTKKVTAYRTAFQKLARQNKADPNPHPLEVFLFHSHPPIAQRIAMADTVG
jgi:STE24 endopeptidase